MKKKIAILITIIFCCLPLFSKAEIEIGPVYSFSLGRYTYANSQNYTNHTLGTALGFSFPVYQNFGIFFYNEFNGLFPKNVNSPGGLEALYSLGATYELPLTDKTWLRFDLGYASSSIQIDDGKNTYIYAGGHGFALNVNYSYKFTERFAVRFALKNIFAWTTNGFDYQYPSKYSGMYYVKPSASTQANFFTWTTNAAIEAVFILGKRPPKTGDEN